MAKRDPWKAKPVVAQLSELAKAGWVLEERELEGLRGVLDHANGNRGAGVLTPDELVQTMVDAHGSPDDYAFRVAAGAGPTQTACMVVRAGYERFVVGATACSATDPTPSGCAAWKLPLWKFTDNNSKRLASWATRFDPGKLGINFKPPIAKIKRAKGDAARERELLADIVANPDDDAPRLVYADWLAERDPPRSEFIVVQCELATATRDRKKVLQKRSDELRVAHERSWGFLDWANCSYRRGFVFGMDASSTSLIKHAKLVATTPIEHLAVAINSDRELRGLFRLSLPCVKFLGISSIPEGDVVIEALAAARNLDNVTTLDLKIAVDMPAARLLAKPTTLPKLSTIEGFFDKGVAAVLSERPNLKVKIAR